MTRMNVIIDDKLEERFRKAIADTKGLRKGNISEALEEAIDLWIRSRVSLVSLSDEPNIEQYRGKYVAIENNKVVASGTNSIETLAEARKENPNRKVLLKLVSDSDIGL
jgi:Family of unknown function (DUF5678)